MFDFANSLPADALPATGPWTGLPAYNFVGGHNDEALIPVDESVSYTHLTLPTT